MRRVLLLSVTAALSTLCACATPPNPPAKPPSPQPEDAQANPSPTKQTWTRTPKPPTTDPLWSKALAHIEEHDAILLSSAPTSKGEELTSLMTNVLRIKLAALQAGQGDLRALRKKVQDEAVPIREARFISGASIALEARGFLNFACALSGSSVPPSLNGEAAAMYRKVLFDQIGPVLGQVKAFTKQASVLDPHGGWGKQGFDLHTRLERLPSPMTPESVEALCEDTRDVWASPKARTLEQTAQAMTQTCEKDPRSGVCPNVATFLMRDPKTRSRGVRMLEKICAAEPGDVCDRYGQAMLEDALKMPVGADRLRVIRTSQRAFGESCIEWWCPAKLVPVDEEMKTYTQTCATPKGANACMQRAALLARPNTTPALAEGCGLRPTIKNIPRRSLSTQCAQDNAQACLMLGLSKYVPSKELKVSSSNAVGHLLGHGGMGMKGAGTTDTLVESKKAPARNWAALCMQENNAEACAYMHTNPPDSPNTDPLKWIRRACDLKPAAHCETFAAEALEMSSKAVSSKDQKRAWDILSSKCAGSNGEEACLSLGRLFASGDGALPKHRTCAAAYFWTACSLENLEGCWDAGSFFAP